MLLENPWERIFSGQLHFPASVHLLSSFSLNLAPQRSYWIKWTVSIRGQCNRGRFSPSRKSFWAQTKLYFTAAMQAKQMLCSLETIFSSGLVWHLLPILMIVSKRSFTFASLLSTGAFFATVDLFLLSWRISSTKVNSNWAFKCFLRIASSKFFPVETHFFNIILILPFMSPSLYLGRSLFWIYYSFFDCHPKSWRCLSCNICENSFFPLNTGSIVYRYTGSASWSYLYLRFLVANMMIFLFLQKHLLFDWWKSVLRMFLEAAFRSNW